MKRSDLIRMASLSALLAAGQAVASCGVYCTDESSARSTTEADLTTMLAGCETGWQNNNLCLYQTYCSMAISDRRPPVILWDPEVDSHPGFLGLCPSNPPGTPYWWLLHRFYLVDAFVDTFPSAVRKENMGCPDGSCPNFFGNPVNVAIGNKVERETDFVDPHGRLTFQRFYNSFADVGASSVGAGWRHTFHRRLDTFTSTWKEVLRPDGRSIRFSYNATSGLWTTTSSAQDKLIAPSGSETRWTFVVAADDSREYFDATGGQLLRIEYTDRSFVALAYDSAAPKRLVSVTDRYGRALTLAYDSYGHATTLTDPSGGTVTYTISSAGALTRVAYPGGADREYGYTGGRMTSLTDENDDVFGTWSYDTSGRAITSEHAAGSDTYAFSYDGASTTVTHPGGGTSTIDFEVQAGGVVKMREASDRCPVCGDSAAARTYIGSGSGAGKVDVVTDFNGVTTDTDYDSGGRGLVTQVTESANTTATKRKTQTDWHSTLALPTERRIYDSSSGSDVLVATSQFTYNTSGQVLTAKQIDGSTERTTTYTYCEPADIPASCPLAGLLRSIDGPQSGSGDTTTFTYYASDDSSCASAPTTCPHRIGDLYEATNAAAQATRYLAYDGAGRALSVKDMANDVTTDFLYTTRGWLTHRKVRGTNGSSETDDAITVTAYDAVGQVTSITQPDGIATTFTYDAAHRLTDVTDALGHKLHYDLDSMGNRIQEDTVHATGPTVKRSIWRDYDTSGNLDSVLGERTSGGSEILTQYTHDATGAVLLTTDPLGRESLNTYDALGRLVTTVADKDRTGATGEIVATTGFEYDARDNLVAVTDPNGLETDYTYNKLGDLTQLVSPDTGTTTYSYDLAGNRTSQVDSRSPAVETDYTYDALNRLATIVPDDTSETVTFTYDTAQSDCITGETFLAGRLAKMVDESGSTRWCYDRFGHLVRKAQSITNVPTTGGTTTTNLTLGISTDAAGKVVSMTYPSGAIVAYTYNAKGQIASVAGKPTSSATQVTLVSGVAYLPFGPRTGWRFGEPTGTGRTMTYTWDRNYDIDQIGDSETSDGLYENYTLDAAGNVTLVNERVSTNVRTYEYDGLDRLTAQKNGATTIQAFTYDDTGNRLSKTESGTTTNYTYGTGTHHLTATGSTARTYDGNGNTTAIGSTIGFAYNDRNRLSNVDFGSADRTYRYNGKGERVGRYFDASATSNLVFFYDEAGHLLGEYTPAGARVAEYVWMDDTLVAVYKTHDTSAYQYIETDYLGTPRAVVNTATNEVVWWRWDVTPKAFGDNDVDNNPDGNALIYNLALRYPGQYFDGLAWINYNYFRDYDASVGRYIESDPIGLEGGVSSFSYARNRPLTYDDPQGLDPPRRSKRACAVYRCLAKLGDPDTPPGFFDFKHAYSCSVIGGSVVCKGLMPDGTLFDDSLNYGLCSLVSKSCCYANCLRKIWGTDQNRNWYLAPTCQGYDSWANKNCERHCHMLPPWEGMH